MWRLQVQDLTKRFDGDELFCGLEFQLFEGDRLALVGDNGSGKSTLLRIIGGHIECDEGSLVFTPNRPRTAFLPQQAPELGERTVWEFARSAVDDLVRTENRLQELEQKMAQEVCPATWSEYERLTDEFSRRDGYTWRSRVKRALNQMQIPSTWWERPAGSLSGGERTRLLFARLMAKDPELLLLDEPTNNLDWPTLDWLQEFFDQFMGTILYVSHDRHFLQKTATRLMELSRGQLAVYDVDYETYRQEKRRARQRAWARYEKEKKEQKRLREALRRQRQWAESAHRQAGTSDFERRRAKIAMQKAKAVETRIQRQLEEEIEKPWQKDGINLDLESTTRSKPTVAFASELVVGYEEEAVAESIGFHLQRGQRLAIVGRNGAGKTTLLRTLQGDLPPVSGQMEVAESVPKFVLRQQVDTVACNHTPHQWLAARTGGDTTAVRTALGCLGLRKKQAEIPFARLSLGQKVRAVLAQLVLTEAGLIFLDEPTNHLDLDSRETIEEALQDYPGTLIFASHDRVFAQKLATCVLDLDAEPPVFFRGALQEYSDTRKPEQAEKNLLLRMRAARLADKLTDPPPSVDESDLAAWAEEYERIQSELRSTSK